MKNIEKEIKKYLYDRELVVNSRAVCPSIF